MPMLLYEVTKLAGKKEKPPDKLSEGFNCNTNVRDCHSEPDTNL